MSNEVVLGLPKKLLPTPAASLSQDVKGYWVKVQPSNVSSVASNAFTIAVSTNNTQIPMPSQEVRFSVPSGQSKNTWLDTSRSLLSFRVKYSVTSATIGAATISSFVQGGAVNFFDRLQVINPSGIPIEDVNGLAIAETHNQIWSQNAADRDSIALSYGYRYESDAIGSINSLQGHVIPAFTTATTLAVGSNYNNYCMPLPSSFLGYRNKSFVPIGSIPKLDCYLTTNSIAPVIISAGAGITTSGAVTITIDNINLQLYYIQLDDKSANLLNSPSMHFCHGITNRVSSSQIISGTTGAVSTLIGIRNQSVRALATRFNEQVYTTAGSANGLYDAKMPLLSNLNYFLGGKDRVPNAPHSTQTGVADVFAHCMMASEAYTDKAQKFGGTPVDFCVYTAVGAPPTSTNGYDQYVIDATSTTGVASLAAFTFAEDLRVASTAQILNGYNMSLSANNYLETNFLVAPSNSLNVTFIATCDVIYLIDLQTGNIEFRV